jgi:hypothetical protein
MWCEGSTARRELRKALWLRRTNSARTASAESRGGYWWLGWEKEEAKGEDKEEAAP